MLQITAITIKPSVRIPLCKCSQLVSRTLDLCGSWKVVCAFCTDFLAMAKWTWNSLVRTEPWIICLKNAGSCQADRKENRRSSIKIYIPFYTAELQMVDEDARAPKPPCFAIRETNCNNGRWNARVSQQPRSSPWPSIVIPTTVNIKIFYGGVGTTVQKNKKSEKANAYKVPWKSPCHCSVTFLTGS